MEWRMFSDHTLSEYIYLTMRVWRLVEKTWQNNLSLAREPSERTTVKTAKGDTTRDGSANDLC